MQANGPDGVEISQEEIPGSRRSMYGYILTYSRPERFSTDGSFPKVISLLGTPTSDAM